MREFEITWAACPTNFNPRQCLFVEAENETDARKLAANHIKRRYGIALFSIESVRYSEAMPSGRILQR